MPGRLARSYQSPGSQPPDRTERRTLWRPLSRYDTGVLETVPGGCSPGREAAQRRDVPGCVCRADWAQLRNARRDSLPARNWGRSGGNVDRSRSDRRCASGNSRVGDLLRDEYGSGNSRSADHHRRSARNRRASEGRFYCVVASRNPTHERGFAMSEHSALIAAARTAREHAHAPYSNFRVGAAVRAKSGRIFTGCNVENSTYGLTLCAERVAIFKAISEGERGFDAVAVVTDSDSLTPPCGACRQILWEFCGDAEVVLANLKGKVELYWMSALLPKPFDQSFL